VTRLRAALADDEAISRKRLCRLLEAMPDVEVVLQCASGQELLAEIGNVDADILLLDIQMPGLSGLETQARLEDDAPYVIYVTAHPEHALEAYDVGAIDYVLKPVDADRLSRALARVRDFLERSARPLQHPDNPRVPIEGRDGIRLLDPRKISSAGFDGHLVTLQVDGQALVTDRSLADLERVLQEHGFERVHRRHLLNLHRVDRLTDQPSGGFLAHCDDGSEVPVSRQVARQLRKRLLGG